MSEDVTVLMHKWVETQLPKEDCTVLAMDQDGNWETFFFSSSTNFFYTSAMDRENETIPYMLTKYIIL